MSNESKEKSKDTLSEKQKKIVFADTKNNILVSAAAGSGKTHVLVDRIIELLINEKYDYKLSDILIMTFTVAATAEMKNRIKEALENALGSVDISEDKKDKLIKELALIENAKISTIDSFCKKILMENYHYLNSENSIYGEFDPSYRIADDKELMILYDSVLDEFLEEKYADKKYNDIFKLYFVKTNDTLLREILKRGLIHLSRFAWPVEWLNDQINNYDKYSYEAFDEYIMLKIEELYDYTYDLDDICGNFDEYIKILSDADFKATENKKKGFSEYINAISLVKSILCRYAKLTHNKENHDLLIDEVSEAWTFGAFPKNVKNYIDIDESDYEDIKAEVKGVIDKVKKADKISDIENVEDKFKRNEVEKIFMSLLLEYYLKIAEEKRNRNVYAISDYAVLALNILYENIDGKRVISKRAYEIGSLYKLIFVDEYQDTNRIQEKLLYALTTDENGNTKNNLFLVGDMKQSIYAFRNAEPKLFKEKEKSDEYHKYYLDENYRSKKKILDFINQIFENVMYEEFGDIDYKVNNSLILPTTRVNDPEFIGPKVEVNVILGKEEEDDNEIENNVNEESTENVDTYENEDEAKHSGNEYEAVFIANKIKDLVKEGYEYKDIMILARAYSKFPKLIEALNSNGIPCFGCQKAGFFGREEINLIIDLLKIIDNPLQDIAFANVLTSELFSITDNELAFIKLLQVNNDYKDKYSLYIYDAVLNLLNVEKNSVDYSKYSIDILELHKKLEDFINLYNEFTFKARYLSISELINLIYEKTYIKDIMATFGDGGLRVANLDIFYENAMGYESTSYVGLFNFIRYIEKIHNNTLDQELANVSLEDDNVVHMTTIHQSKGLQYRVVILCGCHTNYNEINESEAARYVYDNRYGLSLNVYDNKNNVFYYNPKRKVIINNLKLAGRKEEIRLLYVALTRAVDKLVVTGFAATKGGSGYKKKEITDKHTNIKDVVNAKNYFSLIIPNINHEETDTYVYKEIESMALDTCFESDINNVKKHRSYILDNASLTSKYETDSYKYKDLKLIPPKVSVSAIKESVIEENNASKINTVIEDAYYKNDDINEKNVKLLSGSDIGNAYHRYMQFVNFDTRKYETHNETIYENYKEIDENKLNAFFDSDIAKLMTKAYKENKLYREHKFMHLFSQNDINKYKKIDEVKGICYDSEKVVIQGIIDAFFINDDNTITLIDYKTDMLKAKLDKEFIKNKLITNYEVQLTIYADVLKNLTGLEVKNKYIYSFAINEWIKL